MELYTWKTAKYYLKQNQKECQLRKCFDSTGDNEEKLQKKKEECSSCLYQIKKYKELVEILESNNSDA